MEVVKKIFRFLSSILFYSVILVLVIALLMYLASFIDKKISIKKGEYRSSLFGAYIIISESMIPSINVYDAVLTVRVSEKSIEKYDIITFLSKDIETAGTPITHRVIDIVHDPEDETKILGYRTKGDHNNTADFALIAPNEVIGKVFLRIPMIGYLQTVMTKPIGWLLIVVLPCLLMIGSDIFKLISSSSKSEKEEVSTSSSSSFNQATNVSASGADNSSNFDGSGKDSLSTKSVSDKSVPSTIDISNITDPSRSLSNETENKIDFDDSSKK